MEEKTTVVETCSICGDKFTNGAPVYTLVVRDGDGHKAIKICEDCAINHTIADLAEYTADIATIYSEIEIVEDENYV